MSRDSFRIPFFSEPACILNSRLTAIISFSTQTSEPSLSIVTKKKWKDEKEPIKVNTIRYMDLNKTGNRRISIKFNCTSLGWLALLYHSLAPCE